MTAAWHADLQMLSAYADGGLDDVRASSIEAHLLSCETCRDLLAPAVPAATIDRVWQGVVIATVAPHAGIVERVLLRAGVRDDIARLLAATPSLRVSWFLAESLALGFAAFAANVAPGGGADAALFLFLVIAALAPVAGVAAAFGPGLDPTYEIGIAAPMRNERLLLMRTLAVLATSLAIAGLAAIALPGFDRAAIAWLLPSLGLCLTTVTLATWIRPVVAAIVVAMTWLAVAASVTAARSDPVAAFRSGGQVLALALIVISALVLSRRRVVYEGGVAA
ncbi:MAG: zf-HC2 domain-containing protein [Actinomycetota bacterium]|nr:zf-HC2 domain-containing protein [Actinomycetota bacterium]MDH5312348.1 zf-HC2 domain-containing protein [Actinomycetota bacterium]